MREANDYDLERAKRNVESGFPVANTVVLSALSVWAEAIHTFIIHIIGGCAIGFVMRACTIRYLSPDLLVGLSPDDVLAEFRRVLLYETGKQVNFPEKIDKSKGEDRDFKFSPSDWHGRLEGSEDYFDPEIPKGTFTKKRTWWTRGGPPLLSPPSQKFSRLRYYRLIGLLNVFFSLLDMTSYDEFQV